MNQLYGRQYLIGTGNCPKEMKKRHGDQAVPLFLPMERVEIA